MDEETKKNQNIINIVREGQISLLVSAENIDQLKNRKETVFTVLFVSCDILLTITARSVLPSFFLQPHLAADNLELIRDEDANNLLHISASQGHADCLQHLTSLMGEDSLNERNNQQLTPAGLGVKVSLYIRTLYTL